MSALGHKADICGAKRHVRFAPESGHSAAQKQMSVWVLSKSADHRLSEASEATLVLKAPIPFRMQIPKDHDGDSR
jgi:hypothetical protein